VESIVKCRVRAEKPTAERQSGMVPGGEPYIGDIMLLVTDQIEYHDAVE